jgi:hypothetical protein
MGHYRHRDKPIDSTTIIEIRFKGWPLSISEYLRIARAFSREIWGTVVKVNETYHHR